VKYWSAAAVFISECRTSSYLDTMSAVKLLILFICLLGFTIAADEKEGNFTIRFEPTAKLQTNVQVPFEIRVMDDRQKPLQRNDSVELSFAPQNQENGKTVKAWFVQPGLFIAKPVFPADGQWVITVIARREDRVTRRTIMFAVMP
jgi:nitrogen fixation protein FixH